VQAFLPLVRKARGRIAFTASANVLAPAARLGAYQASKAALVALAETIRMELADEGIGVSVVYPSGMITRHLESSAAARPAELGPGDIADDDLTAMMASRPMTEADLTTAEAAAERALEGVLAGEPHVVTHGDLAGPIAAHRAEIDRALGR
jgi:NAD(P)-dependent dehydrogenase (short-subunit alcohol dehydrogenase family)